MGEILDSSFIDVALHLFPVINLPGLSCNRPVRITHSCFSSVLCSLSGLLATSFVPQKAFPLIREYIQRNPLFLLDFSEIFFLASLVCLYPKLDSPPNVRLAKVPLLSHFLPYFS